MSNDPNDYAQEQYDQMVIDGYLKELAEGPAHGHMATFGDAIEKRVPQISMVESDHLAHQPD